MGSCYKTQGAQSGALWQPWGVEWDGGGRLEREDVYMYTNIIITDLHCKAGTKTTL